LHKTKDLWGDSGSNSPSTESDNECTISSTATKKTPLRSRASAQENISPSSTTHCCLICSIFNSLTTLNCCSEHLAILKNDHHDPNKTALPLSTAQVVYMMTPVPNKWSMSTCPCQSRCSRSKRHRHESSTSTSSSSSSSSSNAGQHNRKQPKVTPSINLPHHDLLSSTTNHEFHRSNVVPNQMSPSLPPSSMLSSHILHRASESSTGPLFISVEQPNNNLQSPHHNIETDSHITYTPRLLLDRIVHVKDDDEQLSNEITQITLNMAQATKQMIGQTSGQPKIYLKRVIIED